MYILWKNIWKNLSIKTKFILIWKFNYNLLIKKNYLIYDSVFKNNFNINNKFIKNYLVKFLREIYKITKLNLFVFARKAILNKYKKLLFKEHITNQNSQIVLLKLSKIK